MSNYTDMNNEIKLSGGEKEKLIAGLTAGRIKSHRFGGIAAALAVCLLAVIGVFAVKNLSATPGIKTTEPSAETAENGGVYVPKTEIDINDAAQDSSIAFIVYNGRVYTGGGFVYNADDVDAESGAVWEEYADISQKLRYRHVPFTVSAEEYEAIKGEFLGTCADEPDLCISEEDRERVRKAFEDPSGEQFFGMAGDYYTVNGVPAEKCICLETKLDDCRVIMPFYCLNGVTLYSGRDVFGELLDISSAKKIQWVTDEEWNAGLDETVYYHDGETPGTTALKELDVSGELLNAFFEELYASVPVVRSEKTYEEFEKEMYEQPSGHLYFTLSNGLLVKLRLYTGGYVSFDGSFDLLFKMNGEKYYEVLKMIQ